MSYLHFILIGTFVDKCQHVKTVRDCQCSKDCEIKNYYLLSVYIVVAEEPLL